MNDETKTMAEQVDDLANMKPGPVIKVEDPPEPNFFEELLSVDTAAHVAKKGEYDYLSWPYAVSELRRRYPEATWVIKRFPLADHPHVMVPFLSTAFGVFVEVELTVEGVTQSEILPVLDNKNKPIPMPSSFQINTSIKRCLVKCIACCSGLGLNLYVGEDIPLGMDMYDEELKAEFDENLKERYEYKMYVMSRRLDPPLWAALCNSFPSKKMANKKSVNDLVKAGYELFAQNLTNLQEAADAQDEAGVFEIIVDLQTKAEKALYWDSLTEMQKQIWRNAAKELSEENEHGDSPQTVS